MKILISSLLFVVLFGCQFEIDSHVSINNEKNVRFSHWLEDTLRVVNQKSINDCYYNRVVRLTSDSVLILIDKYVFDYSENNISCETVKSLISLLKEYDEPLQSGDRLCFTKNQEFFRPQVESVDFSYSYDIEDLKLSDSKGNEKTYRFNRGRITNLLQVTLDKDTVKYDFCWREDSLFKFQY